MGLACRPQERLSTFHPKTVVSPFFWELAQQHYKSPTAQGKSQPGPASGPVIGTPLFFSKLQIYNKSPEDFFTNIVADLHPNESKNSEPLILIHENEIEPIAELLEFGRSVLLRAAMLLFQLDII